MLAGGVLLYAINGFLSTSLPPSTVAEIGGSRLYAWVITLYMVGSVVAAATVNTLRLRLGARASFLGGLAVFGVASVLCAIAPNMQILIAGRGLQGVVGGLLAGLGYALINTTLPRSLWTRGSAMWGVATLAGPTIGGLFAQFGLWRWAFCAIIILTALVLVVLTNGDTASGQEHRQEATAHGAVPVWSLVLPGSAALAVSAAELPRNVFGTVGLLIAGLVADRDMPRQGAGDARRGVAAQRL